MLLFLQRRLRLHSPIGCCRRTSQRRPPQRRWPAWPRGASRTRRRETAGSNGKRVGNGNERARWRRSQGHVAPEAELCLDQILFPAPLTKRLPKRRVDLCNTRRDEPPLPEPRHVHRREAGQQRRRCSRADVISSGTNGLGRYLAARGRKRRVARRIGHRRRRSRLRRCDRRLLHEVCFIPWTTRAFLWDRALHVTVGLCLRRPTTGLLVDLHRPLDLLLLLLGRRP
mmetsp:Transcript_104435/g.302144  ORF Transcript_104435/g.302144 Transcript_104435/m.302144 type:complete len:227 (-) Transcript_104435:2357-3037(-)